MKIKIILFVFFMVMQNLFSMDFQITGKELDFFLSPEYNRTLNFCWNLSTAGIVKINDKYTLKAGLALGTVETVFEIKGFAGGEAALPFNIPLYIGFAYNYNGLSEYENHTHSIPLLLSYKWKRACAVLGINSRFSSFFGEPPVFESLLIASIYVIFIKTDIMQFGIEAANFNDFTYGNLSAYFLKFNNILNINKRLSIINEIELRQSGSITLASNFNGIAYHGGVTFSW
jgi:hypothetical protein